MRLRCSLGNVGSNEYLIGKDAVASITLLLDVQINSRSDVRTFVLLFD